MSVTPTGSALSIARPRDWFGVLVVIVIVYVPTAQIQDFLTSLIALSAVLVAGSAVRAVSTRQRQMPGCAPCVPDQVVSGGE